MSPVRANEPITMHKLAPNSIETGGVAAVLKPGKRAIAVKGDKVIGISGFINPGNRVDVLVTIEDPKKKEDKNKDHSRKHPRLSHRHPDPGKRQRGTGPG